MTWPNDKPLQRTSPPKVVFQGRNVRVFGTKKQQNMHQLQDCVGDVHDNFELGGAKEYPQRASGQGYEIQEGQGHFKGTLPMWGVVRGLWGLKFL